MEADMDYCTWFDQRPSHRPTPPDIIKAERAERYAWRHYNNLVDSNTDQDTLDEAYAEWQRCYNWLQAVKTANNAYARESVDVTSVFHTSDISRR
jgi:hypothetical protein